jgi:hypothetical protein
MMRLYIALVVVTFPAGMALADDDVPLCVDALEQVSALGTARPVFKLAGAESRQYIDDADRPAEIARPQAIIGASCSAVNSQALQSEDSAAARLHTARSLWCMDARHQLLLMQQKDSRDPEDVVAQQRKLVAETCPAVQTANVWLVAPLPPQP